VRYRDLSGTNLVAFVLAVVFVGRIPTFGYDFVGLLLEPEACRTNLLTDSSAQSMDRKDHDQANVSAESLQYTSSCGGGEGGASGISCSVYPVGPLGYKIRYNQPSPVLDDEDACFTNVGSGTKFQMEFLNSRKDLGTNASLMRAGSCNTRLLANL